MLLGNDVIRENTRRPTIGIIIPAYNEAEAITSVVKAFVPYGHVVVADNGSTDATAARARDAGATVVQEPRRGYGRACLAGMAHLQRQHDCEVVVFVDGDGSDDPTDFPALVRPILEDGADLVIGSRVQGRALPGAMLPQARVGNWLATHLIRLRYGVRFTDLGPFRAIRAGKLWVLGMSDPTFGWTVEMQLRAAAAGLRCTEVSVAYRKRQAGRSKVTGTIYGTVMASAIILQTLGKHMRRPRGSA